MFKNKDFIERAILFICIWCAGSVLFILGKLGFYPGSLTVNNVGDIAWVLVGGFCFASLVAVVDMIRG